MNLNELIKKYGPPNALIDNHCNLNNQGIAIWGESEKIIFNSSGVKLNDINCNGDPLTILDDTIKKWKDPKHEITAVGFVSYDIKNFLYPNIKFKNNLEEPYYWFIKPQKFFYYNLDSYSDVEIKKCLYLKKDILDKEAYKEKINLIKQQLRYGNTYQVNYTMEKVYKIDINAFDLYLMLRKSAKPSYGYFLNTFDKQILSLSPEQFFSIENNVIKSYPMKGTHKRGDNAEEDLIFKNKLYNSKKDRAEHLMIVDLIRNDLGKISQYGSIDVKNLFNVNSYKTVHQMVSEVSGLLNKNLQFSTIIKSLFPGGSITGAPKESTMKIIDNLENYSRGVYTGGIGYIKYNGDMNFNIPIRTLTINEDRASYPVGGGIVLDSDYKNEWAEAQLKSKILEKCTI